MTQAQIFHIVVLLLFIATFGEASLSKIIAMETPQWFRDTFKDTWLGKFPIPLMYWSIAFAELTVAGIFVGAVVMMEFKTGTPNTLTGWGCLGAMGIFIALLFGQRVSADFPGAASSFFYASMSGVLWYIIQNLPH